jgi:hypothetical protein
MIAAPRNSNRVVMIGQRQGKHAGHTTDMPRRRTNSRTPEEQVIAREIGEIHQREARRSPDPEGDEDHDGPPPA